MPLVKTKRKRKKIWGLVALACVVVALAGIGAWSMRWLDSEKFTEQSSRANRLAATGQDGAAAVTMVSYAEGTLLRQHKAEAYLLAASYYLNAEQYSRAVATFDKAKANGASEASIYSGMALASERVGDHKAAANYYQKLADRLRSLDNPFFRSDIKTYEAAAARNREKQ